MLKHSLRYSEAVSIKSSIELYYTAILAVLKKNAQDCLWQSLARNAHLFLPSQLAGCISLQMAFFKHSAANSSCYSAKDNSAT